MSRKPKKQLLRELRTAQKSARQLAGRLIYRNGMAFVCCDAPEFNVLLKSRDIGWIVPSEMGSCPSVTSRWIKSRTRQLNVWRRLMTEPEVRKFAKSELHAWEREIGELSERATLLGRLRTEVDRCDADDSLLEWPEVICGHHANKSGLLLSAAQLEFLKTLKQRSEDDQDHQLPDAWFDILSTVVWIAGEAAATRLLDSIMPYIPHAMHIRRLRDVKRVIAALRKVKSVMKLDPALAVSEWKRQLPKWPRQVIVEARLVCPSGERSLRRLIQQIDGCQKLLNSIPSTMPTRMVSAAAALVCCDQSTELIPASLFIRDPSNESHPFTKVGAFSLRMDYLHDDAAEPYYNEMLSALGQNPEIAYGFEFGNVRRLLRAGTSAADLRWMVKLDLFDSLGTSDLNVSVIRQLYELLERHGAKPDHACLSELCESLSCERDLAVHERLLKWLRRLPVRVLDERFAKRIRTLLSSTRLYKGLGDVCRTGLYAWESPPSRLQNRFCVPTDCPTEARRPLAELAYYQKLAGETVRLPGSLNKLLFAKTRREKELAALQKLTANGCGEKNAQRRLDHLLGQPFVDQSAKIIRLAEDARANAAVIAFERIVRLMGERWWNKHLPSVVPPDSLERLANVCSWYIDRSASEQTSIQEVVRVHTERVRRTGSAANYRQHLLGNQKWIATARLKGLRPEHWFGDRRAVVKIGKDTLRISVSTDPMLTMRMGDLFNTCLNLKDGCNRYSVVPNLYDANKAVIFAFTDDNVVRARKLVTVTNDCRLLPYHTYLNVEDDADGERLRREIDFFCGEWASSAGLQLGESGEPAQISHTWYDDGCIEWMEDAKRGFMAQTTRTNSPMNSLPIALVVSA